MTQRKRTIPRQSESSDPPPQSGGGLFDQVIDRILLSPERVSSAAQGKRLMAADDDTEGMTDTIQRVAVVATPIVRTLARGSRFLPRVPWVLVASTTASLVVTLRAGVNEVRVLGSLIAYRLEQETGRPADPALVKQLTLQLYLSPRKTPSLSGGLPLGRLVRKWVFRGAIGKDTRKAAYKALEAAERHLPGQLVRGHFARHIEATLAAFGAVHQEFH